MIGSDELAHEPAPVDNWQENYAFYGFDVDTGCGFYLHLQHLARDGAVDVRVGAVVDSVLTGTTRREAGTECFDSPGLDVSVLAPFERWRIRYAGTGHRGPDAAGWSAAPGGAEPFGFDLELHSAHQPVDFGAVPGVALDPMAIGTHYEMGGTWTGTVWSGDRRVDGSGMFVRDHSWGARSFRFRTAMWTPMVFEGGRRFIASLSTLQDDTWTGCSVEATDAGIVSVAADHWVRPHGPLAPGGYRGATALRVGTDFVERYEFEGHVPVRVLRHKSFERTSGLADLFSTVRGRGRTGFGTFQWGPVVSPSPPAPA